MAAAAAAEAKGGVAFDPEVDRASKRAEVAVANDFIPVHTIELRRLWPTKGASRGLQERKCEIGEKRGEAVERKIRVRR